VLYRDHHHWTRYAPLVGACNASNITITGGGTIDGQGQWWWSRYNTLDAERPRLVEPEWVNDLVVREIKLIDSAYWTLHPIYCNNVTISDVVITAGYNVPAGKSAVPPYNTDGIDPDSCSNVLIENCYYCAATMQLRSNRDGTLPAFSLACQVNTSWSETRPRAAVVASPLVAK